MRSIAVLLLLLVAAPVSAQWSLTAYLGDASTASTRLEMQSSSADTSLAAQPVRFEDQSFRSPVYYGGRLTWRFERQPWLGVEGEFIHAKAIADTSRLVRVRGRFEGAALDGEQRLGTVLPHFELSHGLNFLLFNAVLRWPGRPGGDEALIEIVGRLGTGPTVPHVESTFLSQQEHRYRRGRAALAGAVGVEIRCSSHLSAVVEVKGTRTRQRVRVGSANLEGVFATRHVVAGITWRLPSDGHRPFIK